MLAERGARLFDQDSDGDMRASNPSLPGCRHQLHASNGAAANMDIVQVRRQYGTRLAFYGGIDKHVIRRSREEIIAELE